MSQEQISIAGCEPFDCYSQHLPNSPETELVLGQRAYKYFCEDRPQFVRTKANTQVLLDVLEFMGVPITRRNLTIAFDHISTTNPGALETRDTATWDNPVRTPAPPDKWAGITRAGSTLKVRDLVHPAERPLLAEKPERLQEDMTLTQANIAREQEERQTALDMSEIGKPVSRELREAVRLSREQNRTSGRTIWERLGVTAAAYYKAANAVLDANPEFKQSSPTFLAIVREQLGI